MRRRRTKGIDYKPPENGDAMRRAMEETGLEKEIALLRVKLESYVAEDNADIGLILAVVNGIGRALLAQMRTGSAAGSELELRSLMRYFGEIVKGAGEERKDQDDDEQRSIC
jgi:hypothetical protein